jgi:succinyl-CoA synthetase alpha subunit
VIWIILPLIAFVLFGLYVRREAERLRAEDGTIVRGRVKDLADRPQVIVKLKLAGKGMATLAELHVRQEIEDAIEQRGIGAVADAGSGKGWADVRVVVADPDTAAEKIRELLGERGLLETAVVETATTAL